MISKHIIFFTILSLSFFLCIQYFKGVRSAMLNFEEIRGSLGNSSLLMESCGHRIPFIVEGMPGK